MTDKTPHELLVECVARSLCRISMGNNADIDANWSQGRFTFDADVIIQAIVDSGLLEGLIVETGGPYIGSTVHVGIVEQNIRKLFTGES